VKRRSYKEFLIEVLGGKCVECGFEVQLEIDHKVPLKFGGRDELANLQVLCLKCHKNKHRIEKIYVPLAEDDSRLLFQIAKAEGRGPDDVVRFALRQLFARLGFLAPEEKKALGIT
jgi:hypothetical protein